MTAEESLEDAAAAREWTKMIQNQDKLGQKPGRRGFLRLRLKRPTLQ